MSEALTPHLTREQYIRGYIDALRLEIQNIDHNYAANDRYGKTGETLGVALDESKTVLGLPKATLLPATALKFEGAVIKPATAMKGFNAEELAFANAGSQQIIEIMKQTKQYPMETMLFRGFIQELLRSAKSDQNIAPFISPSAAPQAPPGQVAGPELPNEPWLFDNKGLELEQAYYGVPFDEETDVKGPARVDLGGMENLPGYDEAMQGNTTALSKTKKKKAGLAGAVKRGRDFAGIGMPRQPKITGRGLYYPIGDHYINLDHLKDGILNVKKHNLKSSKLPKKKIGGSVGKVIMSVMKGESPSLHDMEKMDDDERGFINQLGKMTGEGKLSMPLRDLTADEKMEQEFEILKGQIIAGNDNEKLVKDFKLMLMRLMRNGRIPKKEGQDILLDLATLGY